MRIQNLTGTRRAQDGLVAAGLIATGLLWTAPTAGAEAVILKPGVSRLLAGPYKEDRR